MHSPESTHELAHLRDMSGPVPMRTMSSTPAIASRGSASAMPAGALIGQASKHLPHLVQASSMASTRAVRAVSNVFAIAGVSFVWSRHRDRKSTRLNSSHLGISYAVFCLKKKKKKSKLNL